MNPNAEPTINSDDVHKIIASMPKAPKGQPDTCPTCGGKCQAGYRPDLDNLDKSNSGQSSVDELDKIIQIIQGKRTCTPEFNIKSALLAHALSCLPEREKLATSVYVNKGDGYAQERVGHKLGFNEALDLIEQNLRERFGG